MTNHRKPPKPPFYYSGGNGVCRQCGYTILRPDGRQNFRANWHPACVKEYRLIHFPADTRKAVWKRDQGVCGYCGVQCSRTAWDVEHVKPLYEANGDLDYWKMSNTVTACLPCHKKKSAKEAAERAAKRRAEKAVDEGSSPE